MSLPLDEGDGEPRPQPPNLRNIIWESKLELPNEGNQEGVHLDDAGRSCKTLDFPLGNEKVNTNVNLHPMQALTPPEKVALQDHQQRFKGQVNVTYRFPYTPTGDSGFSAASNHRSGRHS